MNRNWARDRVSAWRALLIVSLVVIVSPAFRGALRADPTATTRAKRFLSGEALRALVADRRPREGCPPRKSSETWILPWGAGRAHASRVRR